jgi:hypothetical protein
MSPPLVADLLFSSLHASSHDASVQVTHSGEYRSSTRIAKYTLTPSAKKLFIIYPHNFLCFFYIIRLGWILVIFAGSDVIFFIDHPKLVIVRIPYILGICLIIYYFTLVFPSFCGSTSF